MHRLLHMEEILLEIFDYCHDSVYHPNLKGNQSLARLAGTCRAFKEPALDVLWAELQVLTPLVRCLPQVSYLTADGLYSLKRPLEKTDWDVILGFTRRVRVVQLSGLCHLTVECIGELSNPPASVAFMFPKLHEVAIRSPEQKIVPFLRYLAGPRLTALDLQFAPDPEDEFGERCPNVTTFSYYPSSRIPPSVDKVSDLVCHWPKLRYVRCCELALNATALVHLSHAPDLRHLWLKLEDTVVDRIQSTLSSHSALTLPALVYYELQPQSSATVLRFFDYLRIPAIEQFRVQLQGHPTWQELKSLLAVLPDVCGRKSLVEIALVPHHLGYNPYLPRYHIDFQHLYPLTAFVNVQDIHLEIPCGVDLSERELLQLASSWPRLRGFVIGGNEGCTSTSAITPGGFVQLLERCRSLTRFSFPFDVRGYTEISRGHPWGGLDMPKYSAIDVRHSVIEEESVEALAVFFHVAPFPSFSLRFGLDASQRQSTTGRRVEEQFRVYRDRWKRVFSLAQKLYEERRNV